MTKTAFKLTMCLLLAMGMAAPVAAADPSTGSGQGKPNILVIMGDDIQLGAGVTLEIRLPLKTECKLIRNGDVIKIWQGNETCSYQAKQPGVYRVEGYIRYKGLKRGWIFSNPIYIRL